MALNQVLQNARHITAVCTHPATPASGDPVRVGQIPGVALINEDTTTLKTVVDTGGSYDLSVKGIDGSGNSAVAVGDRLYYTDADSPPVNKKATGVPFGYAMEAVASGATATIEVRIGY